MVTRRTFLGTLSLAACSNLALPRGFSQRMLRAAAQDGDDVTSHVNIIIGTGGHGHCFPGATVPFGAVQLSPDTYDDGWDWCAGYHRSDSSIMGFTHTHLSGTGCGDLLDILVMPRTGEVKLEPGTRENPEAGYRSRFSHDDETAEPGYYSVLLKDTGIHAELTATERTGLHQYTFPAHAENAHFIVDLYHSYQSPKNPVRTAALTIDPENRLLTGGRTVYSWAPGRQIYFAMEFSAPFTKAQLYSDRSPVDGNDRQRQSPAGRAALRSVRRQAGAGALRHLRGQRRQRAQESSRRADRLGLRRHPRPRQSCMAARAQPHPHRWRDARPAGHLLHLALPHDVRAHDDGRRQRRIPRHGRTGPHPGCRGAQLLHLLAVGHLPRVAIPHLRSSSRSVCHRW